MIVDDSSAPSLHVGAVTGRYVLGDKVRRPGVNLFACRLRSMSIDSFVASAPVVGAIGDTVTATFAPFGTVHGRISRHVYDGFAVTLELDSREREHLVARLDEFRHRLWRGTVDRRSEQRFMPAEPRSVIIDDTGNVMPCLVIDYSASGVAVSADMAPAIGTPLTVGQVHGRVVRLIDVGFAVHFDCIQDSDEIEHLLEAPEDWRQAVAVLRPQRINTSEDEDLSLAGGTD